MPERIILGANDETVRRIPARHPFEVFIFGLCFITGIPVLTGKTPAPGSMEKALHPSVLMGWNIALIIGSFVGLLGIAWLERITGLIIEQVGLMAVGVAAIIYGGIVLYAARDAGGAIPGGIVLGFGVSCIYRFKQVQSYLNDVNDLKNKQELKRKIEQDADERETAAGAEPGE